MVTMNKKYVGREQRNNMQQRSFQPVWELTAHVCGQKTLKDFLRIETFMNNLIVGLLLFCLALRTRKKKEPFVSFKGFGASVETADQVSKWDLKGD